MPFDVPPLFQQRMAIHVTAPVDVRGGRIGPAEVAVVSIEQPNRRYRLHPADLGRGLRLWVVDDGTRGGRRLVLMEEML